MYITELNIHFLKQLHELNYKELIVLLNCISKFKLLNTDINYGWKEEELNGKIYCSCSFIKICIENKKDHFIITLISDEKITLKFYKKVDKTLGKSHAILKNKLSWLIKIYKDETDINKK